MEKMIAFCGYTCSECGAYLATKNNDNAQRIKTAEQWSKQYGHQVKPEDVNCNGCTSEGKMNFYYCQVCEIRKCGTEKACQELCLLRDYACEKLDKFFTMAPMAKTTLEEIRKSR